MNYIDGEVLSPMETTEMTTAANPAFQYELKDLLYWVIKRKDGTLVKFELDRGGKVSGTASGTTALVKKGGTTPAYTPAYTGSLSDYCSHNPKTALFESEDRTIQLFIADAQGVRSYKGSFDVILDCGNAFSSFVINNRMLDGDEELCRALSPYTLVPVKPRIVQVDWADRQAPDLHPEFWQELVAQLVNLGGTAEKPTTICVNCQGGHGRSGSAAVALMMVMAKDYDPLSAILHLRAIHCPRAIESDVQHDYLNEVADWLGRETNAKDAEKVKSYRAAFRELDGVTAKRFQSWIPSGEEKSREKPVVQGSFGGRFDQWDY